MLGLEPTPEAYVGHLVLIWREVWRVLREDGVCWLNLGDSYATKQAGNKTWGNGVGSNKFYESGGIGLAKRVIPTSIKQKDLIGIPWRVIFALQADGWYLRSDIVWAKGVSYGEHNTKCPHCGKKHQARYSGSCMPESVRDRPTKGHEYLFLLAKGKKYYYDKWAVVEEASWERWGKQTVEKYEGTGTSTGWMRTRSREKLQEKAKTGRNLRSVWTINPQNYKGAHYAVFPEALVRPCILAGTSEAGVCPECGMPWKRVMKRGERTRQHWAPGTDRKTEVAKGRHGDTSVLTTGYKYQYGTIRWQPTCSCLIYDNASYGGPNDVGEMPQEPYPPSPIPATVLDPFAGSGTTLLVAGELNRNAIGLDLSYSYLHDQASERLGKGEICTTS